MILYQKALPQKKSPLQRAARQLEKLSERLEHNERQEELCNGRNSYSKTDTDATFMRMKNDELKAGYNLQAGSENGFVVGFSVHQTTNDAVTFCEYMKQRAALGLPDPERITADSIYGTEEN